MGAVVVVSGATGWGTEAEIISTKLPGAGSCVGAAGAIGVVTIGSATGVDMGGTGALRGSADGVISTIEEVGATTGIGDSVTTGVGITGATGVATIGSATGVDMGGTGALSGSGVEKSLGVISTTVGWVDPVWTRGELSCGAI